MVGSGGHFPARNPALACRNLSQLSPQFRCRGFARASRGFAPGASIRREEGRRRCLCLPPVSISRVRHESLEYRVQNKVLVQLGISRPAGAGPALSKAQRWGALAVAIVVSVGGWILLKALL